MPSFRDDSVIIRTIADLTLPARLIWFPISVVGIGDIVMNTILDLPTAELVALFLGVIGMAVVILTISYLIEYRKWVHKKDKMYKEELVEALEKGKEKPERVDTSFNRVYLYGLSISVILVVMISMFLVPFCVGKWVDVPSVEHFFFGGLLSAMVLSLVVDYMIARPLADGTLEAKKIAVEEALINELEAKFPSVASDASSPMMSDDAINLFKEFLSKMESDRKQ
jgi:hypothetical protein